MRLTQERGAAQLPRCAVPVQVTDMAKVLKLMDAHLDDFNASSTKSMTLVFFMDAVEHIARISRMLRQPRGNAMLVGLCYAVNCSAAALHVSWSCSCLAAAWMAAASRPKLALPD